MKYEEIRRYYRGELICSWHQIPIVHCSEPNNKQVMNWVDGRPHIVIVERYR